MEGRSISRIRVNKRLVEDMEEIRRKILTGYLECDDVDGLRMVLVQVDTELSMWMGQAGFRGTWGKEWKQLLRQMREKNLALQATKKKPLRRKPPSPNGSDATTGLVN